MEEDYLHLLPGCRAWTVACCCLLNCSFFYPLPLLSFLFMTQPFNLGQNCAGGHNEYKSIKCRTTFICCLAAESVPSVFSALDHCLWNPLGKVPQSFSPWTTGLVSHLYVYSRTTGHHSRMAHAQGSAVCYMHARGH